MEKAPAAKRKSGSLLLHLLLLLILAAMGWQLCHLRQQVSGAQAGKDQAAHDVEALRQENESLRQDIAEGPTDEKMKELARDELGMTAPDEYVFYDKTN